MEKNSKTKNKKLGQNIIWIIALILVIILIAGVGYGYYRKATMEVKNPIATMEVENFGTIKIELYPESEKFIAPLIKRFTEWLWKEYYTSWFSLFWYLHAVLHPKLQEESNMPKCMKKNLSHYL